VAIVEELGCHNRYVERVRYNGAILLNNKNLLYRKICTMQHLGIYAQASSIPPIPLTPEREFIHYVHASRDPQSGPYPINTRHAVPALNSGGELGVQKSSSPKMQQAPHIKDVKPTMQGSIQYQVLYPTQMHLNINN